MADTAVLAPAPEASEPAAIDHGATGDTLQPKPSTSKKRAAVTKPKKASGTKKIGEHPKYSAMIADAIIKLKERSGSSRQAILKFILAHYKVGNEMNKINARVKTALKSGVNSGALKQSKGTGAAGSFRLGDKRKALTSGARKPKAKAEKVKKPAASKSPKKKTAAKKTKAKSPKKVTVKKAHVKSRSPAVARSVPKKAKAAGSKAKPKAKSPVKKAGKPKKAATKKATGRR